MDPSQRSHAARGYEFAAPARRSVWREGKVGRTLVLGPRLNQTIARPLKERTMRRREPPARVPLAKTVACNLPCARSPA